MTLHSHLKNGFGRGPCRVTSRTRTVLTAMAMFMTLSIFIALPATATEPNAEPTPVKNPLPSAVAQKPNSTSEEKAMKDQFSQFGFSPRTSKRQTDPLTEPRPLDADAASEAQADQMIERNAEEADREYRSGRHPRGSRSRVAKSRKTRKPKGPLPDRATSELMIRPEDQSQDVVASAATVKLKVDSVVNPIKHPTFLIGVSTQAYEPRGRAQLQGAQSTDFGEPGVKPMLNLDLRWLPLKFAQVPRMQFGFFGSGGYVSHPLKITAPTGAEIENATLSTFKGQVGAVGEWHETEVSNWGLRGQLSTGLLTASQSSSTSFAAGTASQRFLAAAIYYEYLVFDAVEISVGYERRASAGPESPDFTLQKNNFILGVAGGFQ